MSFTTIRYLYCDGDNCPLNQQAFKCAPTVNEPIEEQRKLAKEFYGWTHKNGKDYCTKCSSPPEK